MSVTATDQELLTERVDELERELKVQEARLQAIREIGTAMSSTLNLDRLLAVIMDKITQLMDADRSTLYLLDEERAELWSKIAQGRDQLEIRVAIGEGMAGWVARTGQTLNIKDAYKDPRFNQDVDVTSGYRTSSMLCQPMRNHRRKIIGVMQVLNKRTGYFTVEDEKLLAALTNQAAISIENSKLYLKVVGKNIELLDTQDRLQRKMAEIDLLYRFEKEVNREPKMEAMLDQLLRQACEAIPSRAAAIVLREAQGYQLFFHPGVDPSLGISPGDVIGPEKTGIAISVAGSGQPFLNNNVADDTSVTPALCNSLGLTLKSTVCVPISSGDDTMGSLQLINASRQPHNEYTDDDRKLLTVIAGQASSAVLLAKAREEEMNESRLSAIGQALSGVLHDLKTPMTIIGCNAQLMAEEDEFDERNLLSKAISRQLKGLKSMTAEILSFARGEANLLIRKVFVSALMEEVQEALSQEFMGRNIELVIDLGYRDELRLDDGKLKRAIFNLARNGREAMPDGGKFSISTALADNGQDVLFEFSDSGSGIPESIRHNLFESFVTCGKAEGTGLGLAIVKKFVEQHRGQIDFTSTAEQGTTFYIRLPLNPTKEPDTK